MASIPLDPRLLTRGNMWMVRFEPVEGHEQGFTRPAVIVSASMYNTLGRSLIAVAPITSRRRLHPLRIAVYPPEGGLSLISDVQCDQVRSISMTRLLRHLGSLTPATMGDIDLSSSKG